MSRTNPNGQDAGASVDEWRVDRSGRPKRVAEPSRAAEWSRAEATLRCAHVSADISSWREELNERMGRLEQRLGRAGTAGD